MKFFVSWTSRDPCFHNYDPECNIIVSPTNVPLSWNFSKWESLPKELFIDSGAFSNRFKNPPSCKEVLGRQLSMSEGWPVDKKLFFSHPDVLLPPNISFEETNKIISLSLERAKEYFDLLSNSSSKALPIGVMHGFDEETLLGSYYQLKEIGYQHFALGSLSIRRSTNRNICLKAINIVQSYQIRPLHLFGITCPTNPEYSIDEVDSFDTSTPAKLAFYGSVLYGSPLKRFVINPDAKQKYRDACFTFRSSLDSPLPCSCPICKINPGLLACKRGSEAKRNRAIHNYFQLKWEIQSNKSRGIGL